MDIKVSLSRNNGWLLLLSLTAIIGCGSDNGQGDSQYSESSKPVTHTIIIENMRFSPDTLNIQPGDTVEWINRDMFTHDITSENNREWTSGLLETGDRYKKVVDEEFDYLCSLHSSMTGIVIVK